MTQTHTKDSIHAQSQTFLDNTSEFVLFYFSSESLAKKLVRDFTLIAEKSLKKSSPEVLTSGFLLNQLYIFLEPYWPTTRHLDAALDLDSRFVLLLRQLSLWDALLIFFRERYGLDDINLSTGLGKPFGSLDFHRQLILRKFEDQLWENSEPKNRVNWGLHLTQVLDGKKVNLKEFELAPNYQKEMKHFQYLLQKIKDPLLRTQEADILRLLKNRENSKKSKSRSPWYIRTSLEGFLIASSFLIFIAVFPRLKNIYDSRLDRRIESKNISDLTPTAPQTSKPDTLATPLAQASSPIVEKPEDIIKVGVNEIWRFEIKSEAPKETRDLVEAMLKKIDPKLVAEPGHFEEVPGGIQFNILVTIAQLPQIKSKLEQLAATPTSNTISNSDRFAWYKSRAKTAPIEKGFARAVIWISKTK
jgi:hypothetical protein